MRIKETTKYQVKRLNKWDKLIKLRQRNAEILSKHLLKHEEISIPTPPENYDHIYQMYSIVLRENSIRNDLQQYLLDKKIFCKIYFTPIYQMDFL